MSDFFIPICVGGAVVVGPVYLYIVTRMISHAIFRSYFEWATCLNKTKKEDKHVESKA